VARAGGQPKQHARAAGVSQSTGASAALRKP
jgi:hypothetical protein